MTGTVAKPDNQRWFGRTEMAAVIGIVLVHEVLHRTLAGDAIVSALFAPSGAHAVATLVFGLAFVGVRVLLFVVVPGWIGARLAMFVWGRYTSV